MAKKEKKSGKKKGGSGNPADKVRDAVERTFRDAAGGAAATRDRMQELVDEVVTRVRELVDERRLLDALERLRDEVQTLGGRVSALERNGGSARKPAEKPA